MTTGTRLEIVVTRRTTIKTSECQSWTVLNELFSLVPDKVTTLGLTNLGGLCGITVSDDKMFVFNIYV